MIKTSDPLFLQAIEKLKENKPKTYALREINLYNNGADALQQEILITGNSLQVLHLPKEHPVTIQFNEANNDAFQLKEGNYIIDFYRFFLTYEHLDYRANDTTILKLLCGKDIIVAQQPVQVIRPVKVIVDDERDIVPNLGTGTFWPLNFKQTELGGVTPIPKGYNQIRGLVKSYHSGDPRKFRIVQLSHSINSYSEFDLPTFDDPQFFLIDLVTNRVSFQMWQIAGGSAFNVDLFCNAWSI